MEKCIFCQFARGQIKAKVVYQDKKIMAFEDINPQAPVHILIIPKNHIRSLLEISSRDRDLISKVYLVVKKIAKDKGIEEGFRVVCNCGKGAGQSVEHLHFHLLGGRKLGWPPG